MTGNQDDEATLSGTPDSSGSCPRTTFALKDRRSFDPTDFMETGAVFTTTGEV